MAAPSFSLPQINNFLRATTPTASSPASPAPSSLLEKLQSPKIEIVNMGTTSEAEIKELSNSTLWNRQDTDPDAQGPFADIPEIYGDAESDGEKFSVDGPFSSIEAFVGDNALRGLLFKDTENSKNAKRTGSFEFDSDEVVTDCRIIWKKHFFSDDKYVTGFQFGTNKSNKYNVTSKSSGGETVNKVVGSGYPVRFHGILKKVDQEPDVPAAIVALGIEFLDRLRSIEMVSADYSGFKDGVQSIPDGSGTSTILGTQILDNRNSTINQTFQLTNSKAVAKSYAFTFAIAYMIGATVTLSAELPVPVIADASASIALQWQLTFTASTTLTHTETVTQGTVFNLSCPAQRFCEGKSVFQTYELDAPFVGLFRATTRRGDTFTWNRRGIFKSSDVSDVKLQVNVYYGPSAANATNSPLYKSPMLIH
ncbi:hypothetical protein TWF694_009928 [Orbilia ellipsospora]|uniref:Uncharacterized protein n=1 Tax=Orbilia ellipsospora TaxID=2528407 RepID=A0AAV9XDP1_9PEZI